MPLGVKTTIRYFKVNKCDIDKPIDSVNSPFACICTLYFDSLQTMTDFLAFFTEKNPEAVKIKQDETNFTTIKPYHIFGQCIQSKSQRLTNDGDFIRIRLMWPYFSGQKTDKNKLNQHGKALLAQKNIWGAILSEIDVCDIVLDSPNLQYTMIYNLYFNKHNYTSEMDKEVHCIIDDNSAIKQVSNFLEKEPQVMISEILNYQIPEDGVP